MKRPRHRFFLLFLCLSVLSGSVGIALPERFCRMLGLAAGPVTEAQLMPEDCCSSPKATPDPAASDDDCCDLEVTYLKLEPVSGLKVSSLGFLPLPPALLPSWQSPVFDCPLRTQEVLASSDSSPPRSGRQILQFIHVLLI